jgi:hypothetical protein
MENYEDQADSTMRSCCVHDGDEMFSIINVMDSPSPRRSQRNLLRDETSVRSIYTHLIINHRNVVNFKIIIELLKPTGTQPDRVTTPSSNLDFNSALRKSSNADVSAFSSFASEMKKNSGHFFSLTPPLQDTKNIFLRRLSSLEAKREEKKSLKIIFLVA